MKFLLTYLPDPSAPPPAAEKMMEVARFTEEMAKSGTVLLTGGLVRPTKGTQIRYAGGKVSVTDGPFAETKELIDGFALVEVRSKAEAIEVAGRFMQIAGEGTGEILQVFDPGEIPPPR